MVKKTKTAEVSTIVQPRNLSPTRIETFNQCLLRYWYRYHTKEQAIQDTSMMRFGRAVHSALEELGRLLQKGQPLTQELCDSVAEHFPDYCSKLQIVNPVLILEGQEIIRDRINRHNPDYKVIRTEFNLQSLSVMSDSGVPITGIIDLVMEMDRYTGIVMDYKTSRRAETAVEAKTNIQLSMYDLMISKVYPQYKHIWLVLDFLRHEPVISSRTPDERQEFDKWLFSVWQRVCELKEKDIKPTINEFCGWCEFRHKCQAYDWMLDSKFHAVPVAAIAKPEMFVEEWKRAKSLEKITEKRIEELKIWADKRVAEEGIVQFEDNESVISWSQSTRTYYDTRTILSQIPEEDLAEIVTIKTSALEKYIETKRPDLQPLLQRAARTSPIASKLIIRDK